MTALREDGARTGEARSADGTSIAYESLGTGPGLVIIGGVLSTADTYRPLAQRLAQRYEVHLVTRRGRAGSGPAGPEHSLDEERDDLMAVLDATGATTIFGHSFGGLVALEAARLQPAGLSAVCVYEPGVPLRGQLDLSWLDGYERLLERGDRRGAFAWMVKDSGFAPRPLAMMPLWYVRTVLRLAMRGHRWAEIDAQLEANLRDHRLLAAAEAPTVERFSTITARTVLLGGDHGPGVLSDQLLPELADVIPDSTVAILPGLGHLAPEQKPDVLAAALLDRL